MKLWHDDIRPPPDGWVWARTNEAAMDYLAYGIVDECSLDHDLGLHVIALEDVDDWDTIISVTYEHRDKHAPTGLDLVEWMLKNDCVPAKITIHSWNPDGAMHMARRLAFYGHEVLVAPFDPKRR